MRALILCIYPMGLQYSAQVHLHLRTYDARRTRHKQQLEGFWGLRTYLYISLPKLRSNFFFVIHTAKDWEEAGSEAHLGTP